MKTEKWPALPYESWKETRETLHRWLQIVGKVQLAKSPWINHSWQSALYVSARGISTALIHDADLSFTLGFDFVSHLLRIRCSDGKEATLDLRAESVASFHRRLTEALTLSSIPTNTVHGRPNELSDAIPFDRDEVHCSYDPEYASRFWRVLLQVDRVMTEFRSRFVGKASPNQLYWGSMDLSLNLYSGRLAPEHPGGYPNLPDLVAKDVGSHEHYSTGFWAGNEIFPEAAFYAYAYPHPPGLELEPVMPPAAHFHPKLKEFILPYEEVRRARSPDEILLAFFESTYEATARLGGWDRTGLEVSPYLRELQQSKRTGSRRAIDKAA